MNQKDGDDVPKVPPPSYDATLPAQTLQTQTIYQAPPLPSSGPYQYPQSVPGAYVPPGAAPYQNNQNNPNTVIYVVDEPIDAPRSTGIPVAMICFIFGLCTWVGYLFGMCFIRSKDPRERWWAQACAIMCFIWAMVIIFCSIFIR